MDKESKKRPAMVEYRNDPKIRHWLWLQCGEAHVNSRALSQSQIDTDQTNLPTLYMVFLKFHQSHSGKCHNLHPQSFLNTYVLHAAGKNNDSEYGQHTQKSDFDIKET